VGSLVLAKLLEAAGLTPAEVTLLDIPPDRQVAAWQQGEIDVAVTYEPTASRLARLGAVRLFDSSRFPELILDVLAVREDRMRWRDGPLTALVAAHFRALSHLRVFREDAFRRIGAWRELTFEEVRASYAGLELPDVAANHRYLAPEGGVMLAAAELVETMRAGSLLDAPVGLEELVRSDFLPDREPMP
ncbi:MAG: ABC transporter substrate-binding protein, partial [Halomonas sp.]